MLIAEVDEACVCNLMDALDLDQPKVSRHLAHLRKFGIVVGERRGKWVYYRLDPSLPKWAREVIINAATQNSQYIRSSLRKLLASRASLKSCA